MGAGGVGGFGRWTVQNPVVTRIDKTHVGLSIRHATTHFGSEKKELAVEGNAGICLGERAIC